MDGYLSQLLLKAHDADTRTQAFRAKHNYGYAPAWSFTRANSKMGQGAPVLKSVHKNDPEIFMDCHMMVSDPDKVNYFRLQATHSSQACLVGR